MALAAISIDDLGVVGILADICGWVVFIVVSLSAHLAGTTNLLGALGRSVEAPVVKCHYLGRPTTKKGGGAGGLGGYTAFGS